MVGALLFLSVLVGGDATAAARIPSEATANRFWSSFRRAVQEGDSATLGQLTNFPFVVRWGNADPNDPSVTIDRQHFARAVDHLLKLRVNPSDQESQTMAQVVARAAEVPPVDAASSEFLVDGFVFRRIGGAWKWAAAFTDDAYFFPRSDTDDIPRMSPLRKSILDAVAGALKLERPLTVRHMKRADDAVYVEVQEPGAAGRVARALLTKMPNDEKGRMVWLVKKHSFQPAEDDSEWRREVAAFVQSGMPSTLFPPALTAEGGKAHAH